VTALVAEADRAAAAGDLRRAVDMLEQAAAETPDDADIWMKLAALRRGMGQPARALDSVNRALAVRELDFMALALKAMLLEKLQPAAAGEAWAHALAQRPAEGLPATMDSVLARGEALRDQWVAARSGRLAAVADGLGELSEDEAWRIDRFRSNVLRTTRTYHSQPTHFAFPGLVEREFHPRDQHGWLAEVEAATSEIEAEMQAVMGAERAELVPYIQYAEHEAMAQWRPLNQNRDWTAIHLIRNGQWIEANARHCPRTLDLLARLPQPDIEGAGPNAMFSLLAPGTHIPPHTGINNARLVCHLPLVVPAGCWFRVGAETREWRRGSAFLFDDTIEHEAMNPSDQLRVVFIFDVWHPGLSASEREAVRRVIAAEGGAQGGL
jgi:aspartyl/asparaginyl beta-hydroxylase (cupin superfamily)